MNIDRVKTLGSALNDIASRKLGVVALYHGFTYELLGNGNTWALAGSAFVCGAYVFSQSIEDAVERVCSAWVAPEKNVKNA